MKTCTFLKKIGALCENMNVAVHDDVILDDDGNDMMPEDIFRSRAPPIGKYFRWNPGFFIFN